MPRGGSRKGEKRGGAKPSVLRIKKADKVVDPSAPVVKRGPGRVKGIVKPKGSGRQKGTPNSSRFNPHLGVILDKQRSPMAREREMEMYFLVTGKRARMPKEVMLDAMRYFEERAIEHIEVAHANLTAAANAETDIARQMYNDAAMLEEARAREYLRETVDVGYKVAPFIHPRLAAVITKTGDDASPGSLLATLMRDLDEAGRPARYLDLSDDEFERKANG